MHGGEKSVYVCNRATSMYTLTSAIRIIYCVLLLIVHVDGRYIFLQNCKSAIPLFSGIRSIRCVAAFLQRTNAERDLTQPRPHICVLNQRDHKEIEEHSEDVDGQDGVAFFDALVAVAAFLISF